MPSRSPVCSTEEGGREGGRSTTTNSVGKGIPPHSPPGQDLVGLQRMELLVPIRFVALPAAAVNALGVVVAAAAEMLLLLIFLKSSMHLNQELHMWEKCKEYPRRGVTQKRFGSVSAAALPPPPRLYMTNGADGRKGVWEANALCQILICSEWPAAGIGRRLSKATWYRFADALAKKCVYIAL